MGDVLHFPRDPEDDWCPPPGHDFDCEKDLHGWSICACPERAQ